MNDTTLPPTHDDPTEDELAVLVTAGRDRLGGVPANRLAQVWRAIDDELDLEEPTVRVAVDGHPGPAVGARRAVPQGGVGGPVVAASPADGAPRSPALDRARRRWSSVVPTAVAAGVALVVGLGAGLALAPRSDAPEPVTVASWELQPFGDVAVETTGAVLTEEDGVRTVELALGDLPTTDGFHEVWLLDPATGALTSLGPVRPDGRYVVPAGTDLATLTALDVSAEPLDGDPGHSGASLLRGEVTFVG